jgi:GT2 family glycosyltransferase
LLNANWELVVVPADEKIKEAVESQVGGDDRLSFRSKGSLDISTMEGDYLVFCQPGDEFFPGLLGSFNAYYVNQPGLNVYYYDCEYIQNGKGKPSLLCKPSEVSIDAFLSVNHYSRGFIRKAYLTAKLPNGGGDGLEAFEYEIALLAAQAKDGVGHISQVLVRQAGLSQPDKPEVCRIVEKHLEQLGLRDVSCDKRRQQPHFIWAIHQQKVTIIIPTKDHSLLLETLLTSLEVTDYLNFDLCLVDNGSTNDATLSLYDRLEKHENVHIVDFNEPFNYSRAINLGVSASDSELLLFLNDDMQVVRPDWLRELIQWAQRPEVGVVGTKLIRKNHTIQHAGIVMGMNAFMGHLYLNAPEDFSGLFGSVNWYRNYSALTGACQMVRRSLFDEVGGYDENFRLAFGDIDFCLRIQSLGYRNVYTPFAEIFHFEGMSRGYTTPIEDIENGFEKMELKIISPDPHFSEKLSLSTIPAYRATAMTKKERRGKVEERKQFYRK